MSSGSLPLASYHRAQSLGSGTYGDVITVYNDDGNRFAIKVFEPDIVSSDTDTDEDSEDDESIICGELQAIDIGALREISILRLLRSENSHPNIIEIHDFKQDDGMSEEENNGDDLMSNMGLVMPLYPHGNLTDAVEKGFFTKKKMKIKIAHGILTAVAFLHENGIIHRDIKGDNVMLDVDKNTGDFIPVLIDFSLAKIIESRVYVKGSHTDAIRNIRKQFSSNVINHESTHTPECGTPTYMAPEVVSKKPYNLASDMYSIGVVLLEVLLGRTMESTKTITEALKQIPKLPFANMIRQLLDTDPEKRLTVSDALQSEVFAKFGFSIDTEMQRPVINIKEALPFDYDEENDSSSCNGNNSLNGVIKNKVFLKRLKLIRRIAHELESENPYTIQAAFMYSQQLSQLENCDDLRESQALCDCVVLAHKFFENEIWCLREIENINSGVFREFEWSAYTYVDTEATLLMLLDFCLYPREIKVLD